LLIVGGNDDIVIELNEMARDQMRCEVKLEIIPGATHLFEEQGALEHVAKLASDWFVDHSQIVQLECLRAGIWGTKSLWGRVMTYQDTEQ